jgi:hypothetical protein
MLLLAKVSHLFEKGEATMATAALAKAHVTRVGRDVARIAREM